jgi:ribosome-associated protein
MVVPKKRRPTRPSKAAKRRRVDDKRVHAKKKQSRARKTNDD